LDGHALPFRQLSTASHTSFGVFPSGIGTVCLHHPEYPGLLKAHSAVVGLAFVGAGDPTARFVESGASAIRASDQNGIRKALFKTSSILCRASGVETGVIFSRRS
jgi:hypothetical protein